MKKNETKHIDLSFQSMPKLSESTLYSIIKDNYKKIKKSNIDESKDAVIKEEVDDDATVINSKENKKESEMSTSQSVIFMSHDPIICTNAAGAIEIINPAVTETIGYTPDQMLGQHISTIFAGYNDVENDEVNTVNANKSDGDQNDDNLQSQRKISDAERIRNQLNLMINGQSALVYEDHFVCLTDVEKESQCGVTILGMTSGQKMASENETEDNTNAKVTDQTLLFMGDMAGFQRR